MSYLRDNIQSKMFYPVFGSEILPTAKTTSSKLVFTKNPEN